MALSFRTDRDAHCLTVTALGIVTLDDFTDYVMQRVIVDVLAFDQVFDLGKSELRLSRPELLRWLTDETTMLRGQAPGRIAFVVAEGTSYAMAHLMQSIAEIAGRESEVFRDMESAAQWLRLRRAIGSSPDAAGGAA